MAKCFNKNTQEYKSLLEVYDRPYIVDAVISSFQTRNKTDLIPTVEEAKESINLSKVSFSLEQRDFKEALIQNLNKKGIASRKVAGGPLLVNNSRKDTWAYDEQVLQFNLKRLYGYLSANNIPLNSVTVNRTKSRKTFRVEINEDLFSREDILPSSRGFDTTRANQVFKHLQRLFPNLKYQYVSRAEAKRYYDNLDESQKLNLPKSFEQVNSYYVNGMVTLVKGSITNDTPIEEMLHPFVDAIALDNPELFKSLLDESQKNFTKLKQQIDDAYNDDRGFSQTHRNLELVTQSLTRYFRQEFETQPTKSYGDKIAEMFKWFVNLINDLHKYLTGRGIPELRVDMLKSDITLSDIARLLNTSDIEFKLTQGVDSKVRFSLSENRKNTLNKIKTADLTKAQTNLIDKLFFAAGESKQEIEEFAAGMADGQKDVVVLDKSTGEFVNLSVGEIYKSAEDLINSSNKQFDSPVKDEVKAITTAVAEGVSFESIKDSIKGIDEDTAESLYEDLRTYVKDISSTGTAIIPQVILFDKETGIADVADLLLLGRDGKIQIVNVDSGAYDYVNEDQSKYSEDWEIAENSELKKRLGIQTLSKQAAHAIRANMQKRMLENMGYSVVDGPYSVSTRYVQYDNKTKKLEYKGLLDYSNRTNQLYVDALIPEVFDSREKFEVNEILNQDDLSENDIVRPEEIDIQFSAEDLDFVYFDKTIDALKNYKTNLEQRLYDIKNIKGAITLNKTREDAADKIDAEIALVTATLATKDDAAISALVTDILISSIKDVRELKEYLSDQENTKSDDYITKLNNAESYLAMWEGFVEALPTSEGDKIAELSGTQVKLKDTLTQLLRSLVGSSATNNKGLISESRFNFVKEKIFNTTSQDLTREDVEAILRKAEDISVTSHYARDLATSTDLPSRVIDKLYKRQLVKLRDAVNSRSETNMRLASRVAKLTGSGNAKDTWSWIYELYEDGTPTGRYIQKIGEDYFRMRQEIWDSVRDEKGEIMQYRPIADIETASKEDIAYNKKLYALKRAQAEFLGAESIVNGEVQDGKYHEYTEEFKKERDKYQEWVKLSKNYGEWQYKNTGTPEEIRAFENKYFERKDVYKAIKENGIFTGRVVKIENQLFPKKDYVNVREISSTGQVMTSTKYQNMMSDNTELGIARRAYYEFFKETYEEDLLNRLPVSERDQMIGSVPLVQDNLSANIFSQGAAMASVATKASDLLKKGFLNTERLTRVNVDSQGNIIDTLPIMYTGSPQNPERIEDLKKKIDEIEIFLDKNAVETKEVLEKKEELASLKKYLAIERGKPLRESISFDLPASMEAFSAMAINYDVMSAIEDTITSFLKVMEEDTKYYKKDTIISKGKRLVGVKSETKEQSRALQRVLWWKNNIFYGQYQNSKKFADKLANNLMRYSSLTYVAFNPTGNLNNWIMGRVNNGIEQLGGRFFSGGDLRKAEAEFIKDVIPTAILRFAKRTKDVANVTGNVSYDVDKPMNFYEALVEEFLMTDPSSDIREFVESRGQKGFKTKLIEFGYSGQDAGEYQLQTTVGHAILRGTYVRNPETGEIVSVRDLYTFDNNTQSLIKKDGFTEVVDYNKKTKNFKVIGENDKNFRYDLRNKIREVNKQIHGNYSSKDLMVIEGMVLGRMATQFKKWVMPAIRNRVQDLYYDENLGWIEGRYNSLWKFLKTIRNVVVNGKKEETSLLKQFLADQGYDETKGEFDQMNKKALNQLKNLNRNAADLGLILLTLLIGNLFDMIEEDDDDTVLVRRLKNLSKYQSGRLLREQLMFVPVSPQGARQMYETADSPFAVLRVGMEAYEALAATATHGYYRSVYATTGNEDDWFYNKEVFYQRGYRKGQSKLNKQWNDVIPGLYGYKKIKSFDQVTEFWIK